MSEVLSTTIIVQTALQPEQSSETAARKARRHLPLRKLASALAITSAIAGGPLASETSAKNTKYTTPNAKDVALLQKDIKPMATAALHEYDIAKPADRYTAIDANYTGIDAKAMGVKAFRSYVVKLDAYSDVTHKEAAYYLRTEIPVGEKVDGADAWEVAIYAPEKPVALSVAAQSRWDGQEGPNGIADLSVYEFSANKDLVADEAGTLATKAMFHEINWSISLVYGRGTKSHPDDLTFGTERGSAWETYDNYVEQILDVITPQADDVLADAESHKPVTLIPVLCQNPGGLITFAPATCAAPASPSTSSTS